MLDSQQKAAFEADGFVVLRGAVEPPGVEALLGELEAWVEDSRGHAENWGDTADGRKRFDLEPGHRAEAPRLRRVGNPVDISEPYRAVLFDGPVPDAVADLIGPDVAFHHCKLNIKLPGMATKVDWHQDHSFDPHSNDSVVVALLMLDDTSEANGCLRIVPGSHRERHSHYEGERYVGATSAALDADFMARSRPIEGRAGDLCLMHTWAVHGSPPNDSDAPRRLLICDYVAADARALQAPKMASGHSGRIVRGQAPRKVRLKADVFELPPDYRDDSFFSVQDGKVQGARFGNTGSNGV